MLNEKELKQLLSLLKKIDNPRGGLPLPVFEALCGLVPFVACELAIINNKKEILLTWRDDQWWKGWHFPGGLLRYRESFKERIEKVSDQELGIKITSHKFLFPKDCNQGSRGPVVSLFFLCKTAMIPKHGKFFKKAPEDMIKEHKSVWPKIQAALK